MCTGIDFSDLPDNVEVQVIQSGEDGFDFILVPTSSNSSSGQTSLVRQELLLGSAAWQAYVLARLSDPADLESQVDEVSRDCREKLTQELSAVSYLGLQAVSLKLETERNTKLATLVRDYLCQDTVRNQVWAEVNLERWDWWNNFRLMTEGSDRVKACLHLSDKHLSKKELDRWLSEPVAAVSHYESWTGRFS